ncbi:hypothetical protein [Candidatus Phytoplasma pruni]|uniref:Uncharacterized protein n=1 Tax=Candidatus Phytoplasma pruni TaxID=479893 RepID=A0A851HHJ5_9MOLU|nr:hypothetical protein [Candidatus Phytoplasma pruni]NWN46060.1 hypothetical protein [Candidatus Phytoplasma pruni]
MYFEKPIEFYFKKVSKNVITSDEKFKLECAELEKHDHVFFSKFSKRFYSYFNNSYTYHNNKYHFVNEFLKIYMENYQKEEISKTNDKQNNLLMEKFIRNFHKLVHLHDDVFFFHLSVFMANEKRYKYIYIKASEELMKKIKQYNKQSVYKTNFITEVVELKWDTTKINKNLKVNNEIYKVDFSLQLKPKNNKISQQSQQEKSPFNPIITLTPNKNKEGGLQSDFWERNEQLTLIEKEAVVLKIKTKDGKDKNIIKSLGIQGEIKTLFTIKFNPAKKDVQIYFEKPSSVTFQTPIFQVGK